MRILVFASLCCRLSAPLFAQNPQPEKEVQTPGEAASAQAQAAQASRASAAAPAEGVTYEMILADPDNIDLSFRWARRQVNAGDLKGASATLERIVTLKPNMAEARLLYAIVLYRLDDLAEAERELETVTAMPVPGAVKAEAEDYLEKIRRRRRLTHYSALLSFGAGYDTDRNAAPSSGISQLADNPVQLAGASLRRDDFQYPFVGTLGVSRDLRGGHKLFGSFNGYQAEQILVKTLNLKAYSLRGGGVYKTLLADITPTAQFDHIELAQSSFLRSRGADLTASRRYSGQTEAFARAAYQYQDYVNTPAILTSTQRSGNEWDFGLGAGYWADPNDRLAPSYTYTVKNAARSFYAYTRHALSLDYTRLLGKGMFAVTSLTAGYDRYNAPDFFVSAKNRQDDNYRLRLMLGSPLSRVYAPLKDFLGAVSYEYYHSLSTLSNYSYDNAKVSAMVTYSWGI